MEMTFRTKFVLTQMLCAIDIQLLYVAGEENCNAGRLSGKPSVRHSLHKMQVSTCYPPAFQRPGSPARVSLSSSPGCITLKLLAPKKRNNILHQAHFSLNPSTPLYLHSLSNAGEWQVSEGESKVNRQMELPRSLPVPCNLPALTGCLNWPPVILKLAFLESQTGFPQFQNGSSSNSRLASRYFW
jgi:hypothetical protein